MYVKDDKDYLDKLIKDIRIGIYYGLTDEEILDKLLSQGYWKEDIFLCFEAARIMEKDYQSSLNSET